MTISLTGSYCPAIETQKASQRQSEEHAMRNNDHQPQPEPFAANPSWLPSLITSLHGLALEETHSQALRPAQALATPHWTKRCGKMRY
jgi:hypothetical protein